MVEKQKNFHQHKVSGASIKLPLIKGAKDECTTTRTGYLQRVAQQGNKQGKMMRNTLFPFIKSK